MNCSSCAAPLELAASGSVAKCPSCASVFGILAGAPVALAISAPWPGRTRDEERDDADDRAFEAAANAPNPTGKLLRIAIPIVVVVVMAIVGLSIFLSAQQAPPAPSPKTPPAAPPAKKK